MEPGDLLLLVSDGITEAHGRESGEEYGVRRLREFVESQPEASRQRAARRQFSPMSSNSSPDAPQQDDRTVIVVKAMTWLQGLRPAARSPPRRSGSSTTASMRGAIPSTQLAANCDYWFQPCLSPDSNTTTAVCTPKDVPLSAIAAAVGTPTYVYSAGAITANYNAYDAAPWPTSRTRSTTR